MDGDRRKSNMQSTILFTVLFALSGWVGATLWATVLKVNTIETNYAYIVKGIERLEVGMKELQDDK